MATFFNHQQRRLTTAPNELLFSPVMLHVLKAKRDHLEDFVLPERMDGVLTAIGPGCGSDQTVNPDSLLGLRVTRD